MNKKKIAIFFSKFTKKYVIKTIDVLLILFTALLMNKIAGEEIKYSLNIDWNKLVIYVFSLMVIIILYIINYKNINIHNALKKPNKIIYDDRVTEYIKNKFSLFLSLYIILIILFIGWIIMILCMFFEKEIF